MKKNIKKVKRYQKPLIFLMVILLMALSFIVGKITNANADDVSYDYSSSEIGYDSTNNNLNATNVKDAIDELYSKVGQCPSGYLCLTNSAVEVAANGEGTNTIVKAYTYDENSCITGEEEACKKTICYLSKNKNACPIGTIVDYKVNDTETIRFHVLHDDGETMTMQTQRNTVYSTAWYSGGDDPSKGPQTIMTKIKEKTDGWINVNPITITSDTTSFTGVDSIANLCTRSNGIISCSGNVYDMGLIANIYRARLITVQEAINPNIGQCLAWISNSQPNYKSCRMFMNNFLYTSTSSDYCKNTVLCVEDDYTENNEEHNFGYWALGADSSISAWAVRRYGFVNLHNTSGVGFGARAVVVVNK